MANSSNNNKLFATFLILSVVLSHSALLASATCKPPRKPAPAVKPPSAAPPAACPRDTLKLGACVDLLGAVNLVIGNPPTEKCCPLLNGLADLEAALCLCTAIKANVLGINLNIPIALSVLVSACQKTVPPGFKCE